MHDIAPAPVDLAFLSGKGEMGALMRAHDWTASSLGAPALWPQPLKTLVDVMLAANQAMFVAWGTELTLLYNDAYAEILGGKHPAALGASFLEVWSEIRNDLLPLVERAYAGEPVHMDRITLVMHRRGHPEEAHFSFSYTPVHDDSGTVAGFFCPCTETTAQVRAEERLHELNEVLERRAVERQDALDALRAERDRSRGILEAMGDGFVLLDRQFHVRDINAEGLRIDGRLREAIVGRHLLELWPEAEHFPIWPAYQRAMAERVPVALEYNYVSDRRDVWLDVRAYPVADGHEGLAVFYRDITDRKRAEERLRESEARHRLTLEIETVAVVYFDLIGGITGGNDTFLRLIGYTRAELDASEVRYENLTPPEWTWRDEQTIRELLTTGHGGPAEKEYFRRDGSRMWILCASKMLDERTAVEFIIDVSERKAGEAALRELNETLEARVAERTAERDRMWQTSPDLMLIISFEGMFLRVNPAWTMVLGYAPEEVVGRHVNEFVVADDHRATIEAYELAAAEGQPTIVNRYLHKDGSTRWISWTAAPAGGVTYATGRDITAEKRRQAELAATQEALRQSQKMEAVGQLTGGIAHDFNNMLQAIGGSLELMWRRVEQGRAGEAGRYVESARKTVERGAALTHRLLAFARRQALQPEPVDLDALIGGVAELIRRTVGPGITVELRLNDGAWKVLCDPNQLENALLNLAINARDAMPNGGQLLICTEEVHLRDLDVAGQEGAKPGDYAVVAVADTGSGMDAATRTRAFEPFFTTKPIGQGTGLGLSQIYGFVRQSFGVVRLESAPGQGTTVRLYLPRHGSAVDAEGEKATAGTSRVVAGLGAGATVLLVEDEAGVRDPAAEHLRELGYHVIEATDGPAALRVLHGGHGNRVDLLVTDVGLTGGLNGRQIADAALERLPGLPVLFITGYAGGALEEHLAPSMAIIVKPFALDTLAARIGNMLATTALAK